VGGFNVGSISGLVGGGSQAALTATRVFACSTHSLAGRETETETQRMRRLRESTRHERKGERQGVTNRGRMRRERDEEK
tara:strand:+ start:375 stop:611 length:237 start_codon:yes stop_codon:yes gene_type:complete